MSEPSTFISRKGLRDGSLKKYACPRSKLRRSINLTFPSEDEMTKFDILLQKTKVANEGNSLNTIIMKALECLLEAPRCPGTNRSGHVTSKFRTTCESTLVVCDTSALFEMLRTLLDHRTTCPETLVLENTTPSGFGSTLHWKCKDHSLILRISSKIGDLRFVDCHFALAYICSGMLPVQFKKFCEFSTLPYSSRALESLATKIKAAVNLLKMESLAAAQQEECRDNQPPTASTTRISIETNARHACRKNSYHTDVVGIGQKSHKVVGIVHVTKDEEISSQKHEALGTRKMYEYLDGRGIHVNDHAHDRNTSINKIIRDRNSNTTNSNDRWHAAKSIKKGMMVISSGPKKNEGKTWHHELSDKCQAVRNHAYFAMDNCGGSADKLRATLLNCVEHFSGNHQMCASDSQCKTVGHVLSTLLIKNPVAVDLLTKFIKSTTVYRFAQEFVHSKNTFLLSPSTTQCSCT